MHGCKFPRPSTLSKTHAGLHFPGPHWHSPTLIGDGNFRAPMLSAHSAADTSNFSYRHVA